MTTPPRRPIAALILLALGLWGWTYGLTGLMGADEGRYVQVGKELLGRSNWFLLTVYGGPYDQKPPLPFWMFALSLKAAGGYVTTWTVRIPSILLGFAAVLATLEIGRRRFSAGTGWAAALILMTAPLFLRQTPTARLDVLYTGWLTLSMAAWLARPPDSPMSPGRRALFWGALAGAFFTKGPLALLIGLGVPLAESGSRRASAPWRELAPGKGLAALFALIAGWLAAQGYSAGWDFVVKQVVGETVNRVARGSHENPIWYYAYSLLTNTFMPWTLVAGAGIVALWRCRRDEGVEKGEASAGVWTAARPLVLWIAIPLVVLHLSAGKRHQYLLPLLPPMALAAGWWVDRAAARGPAPVGLRRLIATVAALAGIAALGGAGVLLTRPEFLAKAEFIPPVWGAPVLAALALAAAGLARLAWRPGSAWGPFHAVAGLLYLAGAAMLGVLEPGYNERESGQAISRLLTGLLKPGENRVAALDGADDCLYYVHGAFEVRFFQDKAATFADPALPPVVVMILKDLKKLGPAAEAAGYALAARPEVGGDKLAVFRRLEGTVPPEGVATPAGTPASHPAPD